MSIHILPQEIANAIAAGEVVERPVSVVKELVENAIDADASRIDITIEGGGLRLIEVHDDGCGIPAPDIPLALSRFATSKLSTLDDLFAVRTLGFRGEALASIASVSHFELSSQAAGAKVGSRLRAEGSELGEVEAVASPQGTTVSVRNLFFNVPARLKFMKTEETEKRRIVTLVTRYAMAYPAIRFGLRSEGRELVATPGSGDGRDAVAQIYGWETARQLLTLPAQPGSQVDVSGFISPPSVHRSSRRDLILFVNGRWVQDATIATAVVQAYHGLLMVGRYPLAILFIQLDPAAVDVNVHPAKAEVRFREPDRVFAMVQRTVRATLLGHAPAPAFDPGSQVAAFPGSGAGPAWVALGAVTGVPDLAQMPLAGTSGRSGFEPLLEPIGQVAHCYIVAEAPDGVYLIDQHAAHERVLFESLMRQRGQHAVPRQALLEPIVVELQPDQAESLRPQLEILAGLGFAVEPFGRQAFRVSEMPALLKGLDPALALRLLVSDFEEDEGGLAQEEERRIAARVCKRAAIKAGQVLSLVEQAALLRDLQSCDLPRACPHGRPTMLHLPLNLIERQFGRTG